MYCSYSQTVSVDEARQVARNFFADNHKDAVVLDKTICQNEDTLLYFFRQNQQCVLISGSRTVVPILAYFTVNEEITDEIAPAAQMWINYYAQQIKYLHNERLPISPNVLKSWNLCLSTHKGNEDIISEITPLLTSQWGQGSKYNYYCPYDMQSSNNQRAVTGCVATALAQLMYYFRFPQTGEGNYSYVHENYGTLSADFSQTTYDYSAMSDRPKFTNAAISQLMYHCGVAVDMVYGATSSGMYNHKAAYILKTYFKYSPQTQYIFRDTTHLNWDSLIINHLERKIPLYYAGWSVPDTNGHGFICDGYQLREDSNYYYHFNFGWDGSYDGYFLTTALSPAGNNFNLAQELVINAYPDTSRFLYPDYQPITGETVLRDLEGSFEDGSGKAFDCQANMNYTWVIMPDKDTITKINFLVDYQLSPDDTLYVTDIEGNTLYTFTGDSNISIFDVAKTAAIFHLKTFSGQVSGGFKASYAAVYPTYCVSSPIKQYIPAQSVISDGSGSKNYNNLTLCDWLIRPVGCQTITLKFNYFQTEQGKDFLNIYDYTTTPYTLLHSLSGQLTDSVYHLDCKMALLEFVTNESVTGSGWELAYSINQLSINELTDNHSTQYIYPNPTDKQITVVLPDNISIATFVLYDIHGKTVILQQVDNQQVVDISTLPSGVYIYKMVSEKQIFTGKMVKK
jgi:hypothetical protein